ncbi:putative enzyme related to lactoylglutathione lyase [Bradyrhizobium sp. LB8.2]|uniref:DUF4055 domain-containing protein n=1 Tax=unclassified Bradyrhizobium TaxID=2631580 RepID=UPI0033993B68
MPVDTRHPEYVKHRDDWRKLRDVIAGQKAVKNGGELYLPRLGGQERNAEGNKEYREYVERAVFVNATARVSETFAGMVMRKPPAVEAPAALDAIREDITLTGKSFDQFAGQVVKQVMDVNRCGVLVDFPTAENPEGSVITLAHAEKMGLRVYSSIYEAENIINWRTTRVGGKTVLSLVVLEECEQEVSTKDAYEVVDIKQYRVLELKEGRYQQSIYREVQSQSGRSTSLQLHAQYAPLNNGKALTEIPFEFFSAEGNDTCIYDPLLSDVADLNIAHYRNYADLEHGLHFTGLPVPVVSGASTDDEFRIGSKTAWVLENPQASASYLEFKGEGLKQLRQGMIDKEAQMAALGARMLAPEKREVETAEALGQKRQGEISTLASIANSVSRGLTRILKFMADWSGQGSTKVSVKLNTDFNPQSLDAPTITALLKAVVSSQISSESFYEAIVKGEVISGARSFDEEKVLIDEDAARREALMPDEPTQ